jgi:hypothetical protein
MVEAIKKPIFSYLHQEPLVPFSNRARLSKQPCVTNNENEQKILYTQTQEQNVSIHAVHSSTNSKRQKTTNPSF